MEIAKQLPKERNKILKKPLLKYNFTFMVDGKIETSNTDIILLNVGKHIERIGRNKQYWEYREPEEIVITVKKIEQIESIPKNIKKVPTLAELGENSISERVKNFKLKKDDK
jgi:hypothetical protein